MNEGKENREQQLKDFVNRIEELTLGELKIDEQFFFFLENIEKVKEVMHENLKDVNDNMPIIALERVAQAFTEIRNIVDSLDYQFFVGHEIEGQNLEDKAKIRLIRAMAFFSGTFQKKATWLAQLASLCHVFGQTINNGINPNIDSQSSKAFLEYYKECMKRKEKEGGFPEGALTNVFLSFNDFIKTLLIASLQRLTKYALFLGGIVNNVKTLYGENSNFYVTIEKIFKAFVSSLSEFNGKFEKIGYGSFSLDIKLEDGEETLLKKAVEKVKKDLNGVGLDNLKEVILIDPQHGEVPPPPQDIPPPPQFGNNGLLVEEEVPPPPVDLPPPLLNDNVVVNNNANALPIEAKDIKEKFFKDKFDALIGEIKIIFPENKKVESLIDEFYKVKLNRYFKESALKRNFKLSRIENINTVFKQVLLENGNDLSDEKKEELDKICRKLFTLTASLPPIAAAISHLKNILLAEQGRNKKRKEVADSITTDELEKLTIAFYSKPHVTEEDRRAYYYAMNDLFEAAREKLGHKYAFWKEAISTVYSPKAHLNEQYKELIKAEGEKLMECVKGNEGCVRAVSDAMEKLSNYYDIKGTDKPEKKIKNANQRIEALITNLNKAMEQNAGVLDIGKRLEVLVTMPVAAAGIDKFQKIAASEYKKGRLDKAKKSAETVRILTQQALNFYQNEDIKNPAAFNKLKENVNVQIKKIDIQRPFLFFKSREQKAAIKVCEAFTAAGTVVAPVKAN